MDKIELGYDTICGHVRLGHSYRERVDWLFQNGMFPVEADRDVTRCLIQEKGFKISVYLIRNLQISVQCSLPMVLYGDNYYLVDTIQAKEAIKKVSRRIGMDFSEFNLHRLDTTVSLPLEYDFDGVRKVLRSPKYHNKFRDEQNGVYFGTGKARDKTHQRVLCYYNKRRAEELDGILRAEARINTAAKIRNFVNHDAKVYSVLQESFFLDSVNYLRMFMQESVRRHSTEPYAQSVMATLDEVYRSFSIDKRMEEMLISPTLN